MSDWSLAGWETGMVRWPLAVCYTAETTIEVVAPGGDIGTEPLDFDHPLTIPGWAAHVGGKVRVSGVGSAVGMQLAITVTGTITSGGSTFIVWRMFDLSGPTLVDTDTEPTGTPGTDVPFTVFMGPGPIIGPGDLYELDWQIYDPGGFGATLDAGATLEICLAEPE